MSVDRKYSIILLTMPLKLRHVWMEHFYPLVLIFAPGVWSGDWGVTLQSQCALRGSSAVIQCSYDYPWSDYVRNVQWVKARWVSRNRFVYESLPSSRFEYAGDKSHNCALKIKNIQPDDEGDYYFKFTTYRDRWTSAKPAHLFVEDLTASVEPIVVAEGTLVTLTCQNGCTNTNIQTVLWFRERQSVSWTRFIARREDTGRYTCALQGQDYIRSAPVSLNVQYAPSKMMLTMTPSKDIVLGSAVTFTCSSEANPAVMPSGYSLFKDERLISFGPGLSIFDVQPGDSGQYYCQAWNNISFQGSQIFQSSSTSLNVLYPPMNISISTESTEVIEGSDVNLTCHIYANPPAVSVMWYRTTATAVVLVGSGPVLPLSAVEASSSGLYMCHISNKLGENNSTELLLTVKGKYSTTFSPILAGICVSLLIAFLLALLLYWRKQRRNQHKQATRDSSSSYAVEMQDHIYANALMFQTSPRDKAAASSEVFYTTVSFKPKKPSHKQTKAPEMEDSVIYATVARSS